MGVAIFLAGDDEGGDVDVIGTSVGVSVTILEKNTKKNGSHNKNYGSFFALFTKKKRNLRCLIKVLFHYL